MSERSENFLILSPSSDVLLALPLSEVIETMRPQPIRAIAGLPDFISGASVIRGATLPVLDLARLWSGTSEASPGRFVTIRAGNGQAVLAVRAIAGIRELELEWFEKLPPLLQGASSESIAALGAMDSQMLVVLDAARMVPGDVWDALEAEATRQ